MSLLHKLIYLLTPVHKLSDAALRNEHFVLQARERKGTLKKSLRRRQANIENERTWRRLGGN